MRAGTWAPQWVTWIGCLLVAAVLAACGDANTASAPPAPAALDQKGAPYGDLLVPTLSASVADGAAGVSVEHPVTVTATAGVLADVTLTNAQGKRVSGNVGPDGVTWTSTEPLGYDKIYTLSAEARGLRGSTVQTMTFRTHAPLKVTMPYVLPGDGEVVGVGQPVAIRFDENITDRLAAQRAITITTTPAVEGAFYWLSNREVRWRPATFWKPGTTVEVAVNTYGVELGPGLFGQDDVSTRFRIGDEVIATADDTTKQLVVRVNGAVVRTMPTSMGKDSSPTDNGTYIVGDRFAEMVMDSSTYGVPVNSADGYRIEVQWATQMSYSGIYTHAAPWSVGSQGTSNVSHGCLNLSTPNAKWFYDNAKRGDVVEVRNTVGPTLSGTDGLGDWNIPWRQWRAGNAVP